MEDDFEVILVNARHVKNVPEHKMDKKDSAWLSKLLLSGLLKASFIPPRDIRELRDLVRYKKKIIGQLASEKNRIIKILEEDANIKLSSVLTKVEGATGTKILEDLIASTTDPKLLSKHYHGKIKASKTEMIEALNGKLTTHHQFMLKTIKRSMVDKEALIEELDKQIEVATKAYQVDIENLQTLSGLGASFSKGNRWNHFGTKLVYSREYSFSYFFLEVVVHLDLSEALPTDRYYIKIEIPNSIPILELDIAYLPNDWNNKPPVTSVKKHLK